MNNQINHFICIGAVHFDNIFKLKSNHFLNRTNPVILEKNIGGVAYNIASKLSLLNQNTELVSLNCNNDIKKDLKKRKIKFIPINKKINRRSYTAIINYKGQMIFGLADMDEYEKKDINFNLKFNSKKIIIFDLNFSKNNILKILKKINNKNIIIICGTSAHKVYKIKEYLTRIHILILNKQECLNLTKKNTIQKSLKYLINKNKKLIILITNGNNNIFFYYKEYIYSCYPPKIIIKNENGSGDVMSSIFLYLHFNNNSIINILKKSTAAGSMHANGYIIKSKKKYLNEINQISKKIKVTCKRYYG